LLVSTRLAIPDVDVFAVVAVEAVVAGAVVVAVEVLWLLPPQPANTRDANTPTNHTTFNPTRGI
jgi:hypothetical protein